MQGEQNLIDAIDDDWIHEIELRRNPIGGHACIFHRLLCYASGNMAKRSKAVFIEDEELAKHVVKFQKRFNWNEVETRRAYRLAHEKITIIGIQRGILA